MTPEDVVRINRDAAEILHDAIASRSQSEGFLLALVLRGMADAFIAEMTENAPPHIVSAAAQISMDAGQRVAQIVVPE